MNSSGYVRRSLLAVLAMGACLPVVLWGARQGMLDVYNAPALWVPPSFQERRDFEQFVKDFKSEDVVLVSWDGCTIDDIRLLHLAQAIQSPRVAPSGDLHTELFANVLTGYELLRALQEEPLGLSRNNAIRRLRGTLVGRDGQTSCAVIALTEYGMDQREATIEAVFDVTQREVGLSRDQVYLAGSIVDGAAIDAASFRSMNRLAIPSALLSILLCWLCLRSWFLTIPAIAVAGFGEGLVLAMVYFSGGQMNAVLSVMAPLVFVLTVSTSVHLANYFRDQVRDDPGRDATRRALAVGWEPCAMAATTTGIGLASLMVSDIVPVKQFGAFATVGVLIATALLFLVLPGAMEMSLLRRRRIYSEHTQQRTSKPMAFRPWNQVARAICRFSGPITLTCLIVMGLAVWGVSRVTTSVSVRNLLTPESRIVRDYRWLEANVVPLVPAEVILHFRQDCPLNLLQRLELVRRVQEEITQIGSIEGAMSAATFFPRIPTTRGGRATMQRTLLRRRLGAQFDRLVEARLVHQSPHQQSWRVSTRVPAMGDLDYGLFLDELRQRVEPVLQTQPGMGATATYTGLTPLVYVAQRALLKDMFASFLTALLLVAVVMVLVQRSVSVGLLAMIPNVFPAVVLFGVMGWLRVQVDIGSVMTASVALGIAVDDAIHFLTWFRRERSAGCDSAEAVRRAFHHCAGAMIQTTVICGLGLLVFALSDFLPIRRFAWMILTLLLAALAADLVLLPAMLVGPLGKLLPRWDLSAGSQADARSN